jgi:hypothetical protein
MLEVPDLEGTVQTLRPQGVRVRNEIVIGIDSKQIPVQNPAGNVVELLGPRRPEARA